MKIPRVIVWVSTISSVASFAGALLVLKKSRAASMASRAIPSPSSAPPPVYGEQQPVALAVPAGWRRATNAEVSALPELGSRAVSLMNTPGFTSMPYGTLTPFVASDGKTYATWIEQHYHAVGGPKPWGLHHGVTILAAT